MKIVLEDVLTYGDNFCRITDIVTIKGEEYKNPIKGKISGFIDGLIVRLNTSTDFKESKADIFIPEIEMINNKEVPMASKLLRDCSVDRAVIVNAKYYIERDIVEIVYTKLFFFQRVIQGRISYFHTNQSIVIDSTVNYETKRTKLDFRIIKEI